MPITRDKERTILKECIESNRCDKLVAQYWNLVCSAVRKTFIFKQASLDKENLEEVYQEVFFMLLEDDRRRLRQYEEGEGRSLARWIVVIANHAALNYLRKKGFDSLMWQRSGIEYDDTIAATENTEDEVIERVALDTALQIIPQVDRIIFKLHRFGMSPKDIGTVTDLTEDAVHSRLYRIRKALKEALTD